MAEYNQPAVGRNGDFMSKWNHKIKRKLVNALRGDYYTQCSKSLGSGNRERCVLGVLADILGLEITNFPYTTLKEYLPVPISEFYLRNDGTHGFQKHSFSELADWVETL